MSATTTRSVPNDAPLKRELGRFYDDPLGFVLFAYPWGRGSLVGHDGPDSWQEQFLTDLGQEVRNRGFDGTKPVKPIRMAVSSGHGIGKSVLCAWLVDWIMSTRPLCHGTVTANTFNQLTSKTWASIRKWKELLVNRDWFECGGERMYCREVPSDWFVQAATCREENSEAFAGQHAASSTSFYVFDEASAIPDKIWEVTEGGTTDGEPMWFIFGNPTRRTGKFFEACFGRDRDYWLSRVVDGRECKFTNKELIEEWKEAKGGEDSDWFRVRVRGLAPRAGDAQYISSEAIYNAQKRAALALPDDPLIAGIDLARGGEDDNVIRFRRGLDARSISPVRIPGEQARDSLVMITKIADVLQQLKPQAVFLDATGGSIGGPIGDRLRHLGFKVTDVHFSGASPDAACENMRSYMWMKMRDWLDRGAIDAPPGRNGTDLETDLGGPGYKQSRHDRLLLESKEDMKKRGLDSPDDADALALTFAQPVLPARVAPTKPYYASHRGPWS